jgi:glycine oxidase
MNEKYDFLIVGQGLAGSMLYWSLQKNDKKILVIDQFNSTSSSNIAPGIIHPITGRRMVKTWMADQLIPFAEKTYYDLEIKLKEKFYTPLNILELVQSVKEQNDWSMKSSSDEMKQYFSNEKTEDLYPGLLEGHPKKISITKSGWLNISGMIRATRKKLINEKSLLAERFEFDALSVHPDHVVYKNIHADKIIFCEGYEATRNPFWKQLPFLPAKGEVLTIRSEKMILNHILTRTIGILPIGEHCFKIGSTYSWDEQDDVPTEKAKEKLLSQLNKIIRVPYKVTDHKAAVRPTVKDRRPFIGLHPKHAAIGIFNGLGTKGVLLAPFFANHFSEHLQQGTELMKEVDVNRFRED